MCYFYVWPVISYIYIYTYIYICIYLFIFGPSRMTRITNLGYLTKGHRQRAMQRNPALEYRMTARAQARWCAAIAPRLPQRNHPKDTAG